MYVNTDLPQLGSLSVKEVEDTEQVRQQHGLACCLFPQPAPEAFGCMECWVECYSQSGNYWQLPHLTVLCVAILNDSPSLPPRTGGPTPLRTFTGEKSFP